MRPAIAIGVSIGSLVLASLLVSAPASAVAEAPRLDPPAAGDYRQPNEAFIIRLAAPNNPAESQLALELDNIDVTSRVVPIDDNYTVFRFEPYTPLGRGPHMLRLVAYRNTGAIVELARWTFQIRTVETKITPTLNTGLSERFDEKPTSDEPDRLVAQGSARIDAYTDNGDRRWSAVADFLGNSSIADGATQGGAGSTPRALDIGPFLVQRGSEHTNLSIGHHFPGALQGVPQGNLIFNAATRRGVSGTVHSGPWDSAITAFALRTESIRGFEHGLGVGDEDNRISGGMVRLQPLDNVAVDLGYVSGESSEVGFGTGAAIAGLSGDAFNLVIDSAWFDHRLGLRAEAAHSNLDLGGGFGEFSDQAYAVNLTFQPKKGLQLGDRWLRWDVSLGYSDLGAAFRSIGNLGQIANIREYRAGFNAYFDTLSVNLSGSRTQDNVDSNLYPSTRAETINAVLGWQPKPSDDAGDKSWLFADPYYSVTLLSDRRETVQFPSGSMAYPVDMTTRGYLLGASFGHPFGRWAVSGGTTTVDDHTDIFADMRYDTVALDTSFQVGKRFSLATGLSYGVTTDRGSDISTRTIGVHLSPYWVVIPEKLDLQLGVSLNHVEASNDSLNTEQLAGNLRLSWYLGPFTLWLAGNYFEADSRMVDFFSGFPIVSEQEAETYQVLVGVSFSLAGVSFP